MAGVKWIKIVTDIFDDEKILLIESMPDADSIIVIWFKLLCLAGKNNNSGVFTLSDKIPYTDEMFATIFRRPLNTVRMALKAFEQYGMVEIINNVVTIPNWSKHQNFDKLEKKTEYMKNYMREYREKQKRLASGECKTNSKTNSKANVSEADKIRLDEIRLDKNKNNNAGKPQSRFIPPTIEQVKEYCKERNNSVDAEAFVDFYQSKGWMVGRNKMKDWKAAVRTWERNINNKSQPKASGNPFLEMMQEELEGDNEQD